MNETAGVVGGEIIDGLQPAGDLDGSLTALPDELDGLENFTGTVGSIEVDEPLIGARNVDVCYGELTEDYITGRFG